MYYSAIALLIAAMGFIILLVLASRYYHKKGYKEGKRDQREKDKEQLNSAQQRILETDTLLGLAEKERDEAVQEKERAVRAKDNAVQEKEAYKNRMTEALRKVAKKIKQNGVNLNQISRNLKDLAENLFNSENNQKD